MAKRTVVAGSKLFVGTNAALNGTPGLGGCAQDTFLFVGGCSGMGTLEVKADDVSVEDISDARKYHLPGSFDVGAITIPLNRDLTDAGQIQLEALRLISRTAAGEVNLVIEAPNTGTMHGDLTQFRGRVSSMGDDQTAGHYKQSVTIMPTTERTHVAAV